MPVQVPSSVVSVWPSTRVPLTTGATVLLGGWAATTEVGAVCAAALPATLEAVTSARTVESRSALVSV